MLEISIRTDLNKRHRQTGGPGWGILVSNFWPYYILTSKLAPKIMFSDFSGLKFTGPRSAVGHVSGYRCEADCRSRGRKFDPGPVPYFRGD